MSPMSSAIVTGTLLPLLEKRFGDWKAPATPKGSKLFHVVCADELQHRIRILEMADHVGLLRNHAADRRHQRSGHLAALVGRLSWRKNGQSAGSITTGLVRYGKQRLPVVCGPVVELVRHLGPCSPQHGDVVLRPPSRLACKQVEVLGVAQRVELHAW